MKIKPIHIAYALDVCAKHYGIGMNQEFGQFAGPEAILHFLNDVFGDDDIDSDELIQFLERGKIVPLVVDAKPNDQANAALERMIADLRKIDGKPRLVV